MTNKRLLTVGVLTCLLVCGCAEKASPPPKPVVQPADPPKAVPPKAEPTAPPTSSPVAPTATPVDAVALLREFTANEDAALPKYADKTIVVRGEVRDAEKLVGDAGRMVRLYGPDRAIRGESVRATFAPGSPSFDQTVGITIGRTAVIEGKFSRRSQYGVDLVDCVIKELGPDPAVTVNAGALSEAYKKDVAAAEKEYARKQVLLEGTIESVEGDAIPRAVVLKGTPGGWPVRVQAHADSYKIFPTLTAGSTIRVKGECRGKDGKTVAVWNAVLLDKR